MRFVARLTEKFRPLCEPNPVFRRELRARWRRPAAFLTLFFYAAPLAIGMTLFYGDKAVSRDFIDTTAPQIAQIGRELFEAMLILQGAALLLFAPAIAAPAIAMERERGLLEALYMANVPARRVVMGKWFSCLVFIALLMLMPLPIMAICFFFGGFSPVEAAQGEILLVLTALHGTAIGLYFSSRSHRPAGALRDAFGAVILWTVAAAFYDSQASILTYFPMWLARVFALANFSHPLSSLYLLINGRESHWPAMVQTPMPPPASGIAWMSSFVAIPPQTVWLLSLAAQAFSTLLLLFWAIRTTRSPLKEAQWIERERWTAKLRSRWKLAKQERPRSLKQRTQRALLTEFSIVSGRSFDNPVFGRELRARTRLRGASIWIWLLRIALLAYPVQIFVTTLAFALEGTQPLEAWERFTLMGFGGLALYAAVTGASAFTRERESGTWEGLRVSLLQSGEILRGKIAPIIIVAALLSLPIWAALLCCIRPNFSDWHFYDFSIPRDETLTFWHLFAAMSILLSTVFLAASLALFVSWLSRRTPVAIGLSIISLLVILLFPASFSVGRPSDDPDFNARLVAAWNPLVALTSLTRPLPQLEYYEMPIVAPPSPLSPEALYWSLPLGFNLKRYPKHMQTQILAHIRERNRQLYQAQLKDYRRQLKEYNDTLPARQRRQAEEGAQAQRELDEKLALHRNLLWRCALCPLTMLLQGATLLLILSALMRQKFREEK